MAQEQGTVSTQAGQQPDHGANDPILGKVIDGCRIQRKLGQGGMGVVYLADHDSLHQPFVIKILNPALVGAEDTVERFFREAQACAQLNHTGIVAIQNVGQEGEYYFIRMEYIEGKTLEDTIKDKNQFEWRHAVQVIVDTAEALSHAHQKGMIHRDIKPENIMITPQGQVKVMDFGLAKHVHSSAKVSVTGQIVGTPFFMSPEQAGGKPTDARSDIYSLGVTLYYMLTGVKPFNGKNLQEIFLKHFFYAPESPKIYNAELPEALCEVVKKCLKKKKKERYQSAKDLVKDLRTVLDDPDARISADGAATESQSGDGGEGKDADFGKTIRAQQQEEGNKTVVAQADKTMVAGQQPVSDGTVRVMDEGGGATVRVGEKRGDNDVTVAVKLGPGGAKVEEEEEHPAAGLDLPTTMINQLGLDTKGVQLKSSGATGGAVVVGANKTKLAIVAAIIAVPMLLLAANEVRARGKFEGLRERYDKIVADEGTPPDVLRAFALECDEAPTGLLTDNVKLTAMASQARASADTRDQKRLDAEKAAADARAREEAAAKARAEKDRRYKEAQVKLTALEAERAAKRYRKYTEDALAFVKEYEEFGDLTSGVQIPVICGSDPEGAELMLVDDAGNETLQPDRTPAVVWVRPNRDFVIKIRKLGFVEKTFTGSASAYIEPIEEDLTRKVLREIALPEAQVTIGVRTRMEPLTPSSQPAVDQSTGDIYWVSHDGTLRALNVKRGQAPWKFNLGEHRIGLYGDPTPSPTAVPGQVVLASSLLGRLSAHRPANDGIRIWTIEAGAPVTSPTAFVNKGSEAIVAAGTATGEVVFVLGSQFYWRFRTQNVVVSAPYLQGDLAFVGSTDDRLYALDYTKRVELGSIDLGADVIDGPRAIGRNLACVTADGVLHVIDVTTPSAMREVAAVGAKTEVRPGQGLEVVADRVFVSVGREVRAYVVSATGVKDGWAAPFSCPSNVTRVAPAGDVVYVGGQSGFLYALDRATGEVRWRHPVPGGQITFAPFVVDQELFVFAGGKVVVLQAD
jgi:outer membrane protein assembly factor BamB/predicted Ser/Thr protein kinase/CRISPR/Cas system CMR-associated protein Cmr5 small subunit